MPEKTENDWMNIANDLSKNAIPELYWCCGWETRSNKNANGQWISFITTNTSSHSLLLALVDANYCFIAVYVGAVGKSSDSNVFKKSNRKETGIRSTGNPREQAVA